MKNCLALVSSSMPSDEICRLEKTFDVLSLPSEKRLPPPVAHHPDMIFSRVGDSIVFPAHYYREHRESVEFISDYSGLNLVLAEEELAGKYPHDVLFNNTTVCAGGQKKLICSLPNTSKAVTDEALKHGMGIISVKQGYAGCSSISTGDSLLTSDIGIYKKAKENGIDCVYADKSGILLPGYDCGFIGGSGGYFDGVLYFCGDISSIPSAEVIYNFAEKRGLGIVSLSQSALSDRGGIRFLEKRR